MYHFYLDGSYSKETQRMGLGFVLTAHDGTIIWQHHKPLDNYLHYEEKALLEAMTLIVENEVFPVTIYTDSKANAEAIFKSNLMQSVLPKNGTQDHLILLQKSYTLMRPHDGKIHLQYLPRQYNMLADTQAKGSGNFVAHRAEYVLDCIHKFFTSERENLHFFLPNDPYLSQKSFIHGSLGDALDNLKKIVHHQHQYVLFTHHGDNEETLRNFTLLNRHDNTYEKLTFQSTDIHPNLIPINCFEQIVDYLLSKNIYHISLDVLQTRFRTILTHDNIIEPPGFKRFKRLFKSLTQLKEVSFICSPIHERLNTSLIASPSYFDFNIKKSSPVY